MQHEHAPLTITQRMTRIYQRMLEQGEIPACTVSDAPCDAKWSDFADWNNSPGFSLVHELVTKREESSK